jgi:myo-inositol-1(or 4)-monophosphatase
MGRAEKTLLLGELMAPRSNRMAALPATLRSIPEMRFIHTTFKECLRTVAAVSRARRREPSVKADGSLFTGLDSGLDRLWRTRTRERFPLDVLLSEEEGELRPGRRIWIVDPLDGTTNWNAGIPFYSVSAALAVDGKVCFGGVLLPTLGLSYYTARGRGAYCGPERIRVRQSRELQFDSVVTFCSWRSHDVGLLRLTANVRAFGSTAYHLSLLASGATEGAIELGCRVWDFAAGLLLVEEAGGATFSSVPLSELLSSPRVTEIVPVFAAPSERVLRALRSAVKSFRHQAGR